MNQTKKFRKKPVVIEAIRWTGDNVNEVIEFTGNVVTYYGIEQQFIIPTLEGDMDADCGSWVIRGIQGELYPCKPDIFDATYEEVA